MKKKVLIIIGIILLLILLIFGIWYIIDKNKVNNNEPTNPIASTTLTDGTDVILSLEDTITNNSCLLYTSWKSKLRLSRYQKIRCRTKSLQI